MNPPYGGQIKAWIRRAYEEHTANGTIIVCLVPARTDTQWFHKYIYSKAEIRFVKGRLYFGIDGNFDGRAPFPSMVVIFQKG